MAAVPKNHRCDKFTVTYKFLHYVIKCTFFYNFCGFFYFQKKVSILNSSRFFFWFKLTWAKYTNLSGACHKMSASEDTLQRHYYIEI